MGTAGGKGTRVSDFFFTKNPNLKKKYFFCCFLGGGCGGVGGIGKNRRTGPNQFAICTFNFFETGG